MDIKKKYIVSILKKVCCVTPTNLKKKLNNFMDSEIVLVILLICISNLVLTFPYR